MKYTLCSYFPRAPHAGTGAAPGPSEADADAIDALLQSWAPLQHVRVDRTQLRASHEAWLHVLVAPQRAEIALYSGLGESANRAILTWRNSD